MKIQYKEIKGRTFGEERALYGASGISLVDCAFAGAEDGESALKEASCIRAERLLCELRYPFWHTHTLTLTDTTMTETCRAALWYAEGVSIGKSTLHGTKAVRECRNVSIAHSNIRSDEFGWFSKDLTLSNSEAEGAYFLLRTENVTVENLKFKGKYSFQYIQNATLENCTLDTKDAFWHAENVTVRNCTVKGEYLGWYSKHLTFEHCLIIGTQPLCYCEDLTLIDCELLEADLAFERSQVHATLTAPVDSIKNPYGGEIRLPRVGETILTDPEAKCRIITES